MITMTVDQHAALINNMADDCLDREMAARREGRLRWALFWNERMDYWDREKTD